MRRIIDILRTITPAMAYMAVLALPALGQTHTLTIQNGEVRIDGLIQDKDQLPASLDLDDVTVLQLSFTAATETSFELNGHYYTIRDGRLIEVPSPEPFPRSRTAVVFRDDQPRQPLEAAPAAEDFDDAGINAVASPLMQHYFMAVQREDDALYQRLVTEFDLEAETVKRAHRIRSMAPGVERDQQTEELRQMLEQIFELKQENRRMEITQLEKQLNELQRRLAEREDLKERIIEQRLQELLQ